MMPRVTWPMFVAVSVCVCRIERNYAGAIRHDVCLLADIQVSSHYLHFATQLQALSLVHLG